MMPATLRVIETGHSTTLQDHGRVGRADLGVPRAGAVDRETHDLANRLVGNHADAASFETRGGLVVRAIHPVVVAVDGDRYTLGGGEELRVDSPEGRMWSYLAVRGGIDVDPVLGSRSHDTLAGVGPARIEAGAELGIGSDPATELVADHAPPRRRDPIARLWPGPRADRFVDALATLVGRSWTVTGAVSRVGVRLPVGDFVAVGDHRTPSEGLVAGAVQITPSGQPIIMLANHPTTGGYPVVAVVEPDDLAIVAQSPPGTVLRFVLA